MTSEFDPRLLTILQELHHLTVRGNVKWEAISPDDEQYGTVDTYRYSTPKSTISISSNDQDGTFPFVVTLSDSAGNVVEVVNQRALSENDPFEGALRAVIDELRLAARRNALGIDDILNSLMRDLGIEGKEPKLKKPPAPQHNPRRSVVDDPWSQPAGSYSDEPPF